MTHPGPSRMLARLLDETIRNRIPAFGRTAVLRNLVARVGLPRGATVVVVGRQHSRPEPELESLRVELDAAAILVLERRSCRTVFVFQHGHEPVSVAKLPRAGDRSVAHEHGVLERLADLSLAPKPLGASTLPSHGDVFLQEMVRGEPLRPQASAGPGASALGWDGAFESACEGLSRLADRTAGPLDGTDMEPVEAVLRDTATTSRTRNAVESALENVGERGVLRHGDTSPQNVLVESGKMAAMVDWELAKDNGAPGFDVLNLTLAAFERSIALQRLSPHSIPEAFANSWGSLPFWQEARRWADEAARSAGTSEAYRENLVTLFFARRLGRRLAGAHHPVARDLSRSALEVVCAH